MPENVPTSQPVRLADLLESYTMLRRANDRIATLRYRFDQAQRYITTTSNNDLILACAQYERTREQYLVALANLRAIRRAAQRCLGVSGEQPTGGEVRIFA